MEVPHHPDIHHKPKKWKEYFLEFLMIFLAVTMGFLAERYRENLNDHAKEREYIQSLVADLQSDQQVLLRHIAGIVMMDSLVMILNTPTLIAKNTGELYYLARLGPRLYPLITNDRTFEQLKNSGNFRLIRNLSVSNKIMTYYEKFPLIKLLESINETEFTEFKKGAAKIFEPAVFLEMEKDNGDVERIPGNLSLRTFDSELLKELATFGIYMHGTKKGILSADKDIKSAGAELITYLQNEYHLDNE